MADVTIDLSGFERVMRDYPGKVDRWLDGLAEDTVTDIRLSFGASPSPPGGPPGVDTGTLRASISWEATGRFERTVMDGVEYGVKLEDGTDRIAPRPWMRPAFDRLRQKVEADARTNLNLE